MSTVIRVIDPDCDSRARVARDLTSKDFRADIYENVGEFLSRTPTTGFIFASENSDNRITKELKSAWDAKGLFLPFVAYSEKIVLSCVVESILSGAVDYLQFPFDDRCLDNAMNRLYTLGVARARDQWLSAMVATQIRRLSPREREVAGHLVRGSANKTMATEMGISYRTVEIHRSNLMRKLGAKSAADVIRLAILGGLGKYAKENPLTHNRFVTAANMDPPSIIGHQAQVVDSGGGP